MYHSVEESLQSEPDPLVSANQFYKNVLHASNINRYDSDPEFDEEFNRMGIDVSIVMDDKTYYISENFRKNINGYFYFEVFHNYPDVDGWIHTGSPDYIAYFTKENVYMIQCKSLQEFYDDKLFSLLPEDCYENLSESKKTIINKDVEMDEDDEVEIHLVKTPDLDNKNTCGAIGIEVPIETLEKYGVKIKMYQR